MANSLIEFNSEFREVQTTGDPCTACNEPIYGKQFQLFMEPGGATGTILCQSCMDAIEQ
jgi:hypothetical protein